MLPRITLALVIGLLVSGCGDVGGPREGILTKDGIYLADPVDGEEVPRPKLEDGIFPVAEVRVSPGQLPARYAGGLPLTIEAFSGSWDAYPPRVYIEKRLCGGDPEMLAKLEQALASARAAAASDIDLVTYYGELVRWCGADGPCDWALAQAFEPGPASTVAWVALRNCEGERFEALFSRPDAPGLAVIEYWDNWKWSNYGEPIPYTTRLAAAVQEIDSSWARHDIRSASFTLAYTQDTRAVQVLLDVHNRLPAGELRNAIIPGMKRLDDPVLDALVDDYCRGQGERDPICREDETDPPAAPTEPEPPADTCFPDADTQSLIAEGDWSASSDAEQCLRELAQRDRSAARRQAEAILALDPPGMRLATAARALTTFATHEDLINRLLELGLLNADDLRTANAPDNLTAEDVLIEAGRILWFDVETGTYPNQHEGLLLDFAAAAGPPLSNTMFEERAPIFDLGDGTYEVDGAQVDRLPKGRRIGEPYLVRAYLADQIFEVEAQDFGDWYDLDQCLGLFNAIAIHVGDDTRAVSLPTGDQTAVVLIAPRPAIITAIAEGLINQADAGTAMEVGKAFEGRVFRELSGG